MSKKDKLRRIKYLMYKHSPFDYSKECVEKTLNELYSVKYPIIDRVNKLKEVLEIYALSKELQISDKDFNEMWFNVRIERRNNDIKKRLKPQKETRDNKGVLVGSGGSNINKIRYPSKKRSLRVWKKFYEMFPYLAEKDKWNGKKSKRVNKRKK